MDVVVAAENKEIGDNQRFLLGFRIFRGIKYRKA
jgi:hypothetical protein